MDGLMSVIGHKADVAKRLSEVSFRRDSGQQMLRAFSAFDPKLTSAHDHPCSISRQSQLGTFQFPFFERRQTKDSFVIH
jgi:hypothetical protein